ALPANGTQTITNNAIAGTFVKGVGSGTSGGSVFGINVGLAVLPPLSGQTLVNSNNNFSNITVGGTTAALAPSVTCVRNDDGATKTVQNNTCNNWVGGISNFTGILVNNGSGTVSGNTITNFSSGGAASTSTITGIQMSVQNSPTVTIGPNTIQTLSTTNGNIQGIVVASPNIGVTAVATITGNTITGLTCTTGGAPVGITAGGINGGGTLN